MTEFEKLVFDACSKIPRGKVSTYQKIAALIGRPNAYRAVGNALNKNRSKSVPCHRVICSDGSIGGFAHGQNKKLNLLKNEGIVFVDKKLAAKQVLL